MARGEQAKDGQICRLEPLPTLRHDHHRAGHCLPRPHAPSELYADKLAHILDQMPVERAVLGLFCDLLLENGVGSRVGDIGCGSG